MPTRSFLFRKSLGLWIIIVDKRYLLYIMKIQAAYEIF